MEQKTVMCHLNISNVPLCNTEVEPQVSNLTFLLSLRPSLQEKIFHILLPSDKNDFLDNVYLL